jgi:3-oxoacyl-[acyl-carrier protein] reductase
VTEVLSGSGSDAAGVGEVPVITGQVAVVSGGSRGMGQRLVTRLLADGWNVATFSRSDNDFVRETAAQYGDAFCWQRADLGEPGTLREFVSGVVLRFGRVDLLVNNAALLYQNLFLTTPPKQLTELVVTNLVAPITLAQVCARAMSRTGTGGSILNVSSINAIRGYRGVAVYSATKAGLDGFSRSLARELGPLGIRVNSVIPGFFDSDMTAEVTDDNRDKISRRTPLGRLGHVDEVVDVVMFMVSQKSSFVTGQTIVVDGGITC